MKARIRLRNQRWMLDQMVEGVRHREALGRGSKDWAQGKANERLRDLMLAGPVVKECRSALVVDDLQEAWKRYAISQRLSDRHRLGAWSAFRRVMCRGAGADGGVLRLDSLGPEVVEDYREFKLSDSDDEIDQDRKERSAYSDWRNARSVIQGRAMDYYRRRRELVVPGNLDRLRAFQLPRPPAFQYVLPPRELIEATEREAAALQGGMRMVYRLAMNAGLRASEMVAMTGEWVEDRQGQWVIAVGTRERFRPKGLARWVPVPDALARDCLSFGADPVLGLQTKTAREDLIRYEFSNWMRSIGWERRLYGKSAHELRKLFGSRIFTDRTLGPAYAQQYLGHASIDTTCRYYATLDAPLRALPER